MTQQQSMVSWHVLDGRRLELLGLVALIDPLRPEVVDAVDACHRAGVSVKMITGDHAATAAAIGRDLGIVGHGPPMTGAEIARARPRTICDTGSGPPTCSRAWHPSTSSGSYGRSRPGVR